MSIKLNLIAAVSANMGIGKNNNLPWRLRTEMDYFTRMTTSTDDPTKRNVVIMGRKTWDSIPIKFKPLINRINFVLSRSDFDASNYENVFAFTSLEKAIDKLKDDEFKAAYEIVWIIGGHNIYDICMQSEHFFRVYLTRIKKEYDCDTFFPKLADNLKEIELENVPKGIQCENGTDFEYKVYENSNIGS